MRKLACTGGVLIAALLAAAGPAAAQVVPTKGTLEACHTGDGPLDRYATFFAQMGTISGAKRLQVRFDLLQRLPGAKSFSAIAGPGLAVWTSSTKDVYRYRKTVAALQAPAGYRAVVRFRWIGPKGNVIRRTSRKTAICSQPDPGADLSVGTITAKKAGSGRVEYLVTILNQGRSDAGAFDVSFTLGSGKAQRETVEGLAAGDRTTISFVGARCSPGDQITVQVDPDGHIEQSDRTDDQKVVDCPNPAR